MSRGTWPRRSSRSTSVTPLDKDQDRQLTAVVREAEKALIGQRH